MKTTFKIIIPALLILAGCSGGAGKFTGKWRRADAGKNEPVIIIEAKGDKYDLYPEDRPGNFMPFSYDKEHDMLTAAQGNAVIDVTYDSQTRHLKMSPRGGGGLYGSTMELERVK